MMTVFDLIQRLAALPSSAPVNAAVVGITGWYPDTSHAQVDSLDVRLDHDGQVLDVWLVAHSTSPQPPALLSIPCPCGMPLIVDDTNPWPADHLVCQHRVDRHMSSGE